MHREIIFLTEEIVKAGGIARVVSLWANYFSQSKQNKVKVVASSVENPFYKFYKTIHIQQHNFAYKRKFLGLPYNIYQTYKFLNSQKNQMQTNLIVDRAIHIEPIWLLRKFGMFKKMNLIYFFHGGSSDFRQFYMNRPYTKHRVKMVFQAFDKAICLFDDETDYPQTVNIEKLFFIENPLPFEPNDVAFEHKSNILLSLGRITKAKGIDTLIKAWAELSDITKNWEMHIVGDGEDKEIFVEMVRHLNISNILFRDSTSDVLPIYETAKIFVIPSVAEGMPMTILEAMANKTCVISSNTAGGIQLIKDQKTGLLFEIGDVEFLSRQIKFLIENGQIRKEIAIEAFNHIKPHTIKNIARKWGGVLNE